MTVGQKGPSVRIFCHQIARPGADSSMINSDAGIWTPDYFEKQISASG